VLCDVAGQVCFKLGVSDGKPPAHANPFKRIEARIEQPRRDEVTAANLAANERVNVALLGALAGAPSC
jgi:hypothetical protein